MLMGFGCSVPAIMAARTLEKRAGPLHDHDVDAVHVLLGQDAVYGLFIAAFFPAYKGLVVFGIYAAGLIVAIVCAMFLKKTVLKGGHAPFVMELPPYPPAHAQDAVAAPV